jgi:ribonuclease Y
MVLNTLVYFSSFVIGAVLGAVATYITRRVMMDRQIRIAQRKAARMVTEARNEAKEVLNSARDEAAKNRAAADGEYRERRSELHRQENRVAQKGETLERKLEGLDQRERSLTNKEKEVENVRAHLEEARNRQLKQLELISGMSSAEAKEELMENAEVELRGEMSRRMKQWEQELKEEADNKSQEILSQVIQRSASEIVSETTVSVVPVPSDEMKGRLIGREGRNIRALEQATGVDLIIDDTPEAVTISSFDPVRREEDVEVAVFTAGEQAAYQVGVTGLHPELIKLLGRLKYRTSYGQNVLAHSIETAYMAGMIASELGANVAIAKRAGLLHDIGKSVDRGVEGTHAAIGAELAKQWEKSPEVVQGIAGHHLETSTSSTWDFIISAADAISSARPGARREILEGYLKRLKALEDIANSFKGVEKSYAIQAGREVRILVKPEEIDDLGAMRLARDIVKKITAGLEYPGQVKVTVIRETRAVDYAK